MGRESLEAFPTLEPIQPTFQTKDQKAFLMWVSSKKKTWSMQKWTQLGTLWGMDLHVPHPLFLFLESSEQSHSLSLCHCSPLAEHGASWTLTGKDMTYPLPAPPPPTPPPTPAPPLEATDLQLACPVVFLSNANQLSGP